MIEPILKCFHREEFWRSVFPALFSKESFSQAEREVEGILFLSRISGGRFLDVGCGPGRHSLVLAQMGFDVTGVDRSAYLLEKARKGQQDAGVRVHWFHSDFLSWRPQRDFSVIINMSTSLGYDGVQADKMMLAKFNSLLGPGGVLFLEMASLEVCVKQSPFAREVRGPFGVIHEESVFDSKTQSVTNTWTVSTDREIQVFSGKIRVYSKTEISQFLSAAGLVDLQFFGGYGGETYDAKANRLLVLARKGINPGKIASGSKKGVWHSEGVNPLLANGLAFYVGSNWIPVGR